MFLLEVACNFMNQQKKDKVYLGRPEMVLLTGLEWFLFVKLLFKEKGFSDKRLAEEWIMDVEKRDVISYSYTTDPNELKHLQKFFTLCLKNQK